MVCTCCLPAYFFLHFACIVLVVYITTRLLVREKSSLLWKVSVWFFNGIFFLVFTSFLVLGSSEDLRAYVFSRVFFYIANLENIDPVRLHLLKGLSGRVLEIGPGPGTNFRYIVNNTAITEWVGVEPNTYFQEKQMELIQELKPIFKTSTVWKKGESKDLDIDTGSFDYVIGTHVLCSVDDVAEVLKQVKRALKPTGQYIFYEHVLTDSDETIRLYQQFFAPFFYYLGNNCKFKELWKDIDYHLSQEMDLQLTHLQADVVIPILRPHIIGSATKFAFRTEA